jgi:hypothetical protein
MKTEEDYEIYSRIAWISLRVSSAQWSVLPHRHSLFNISIIEIYSCHSEIDYYCNSEIDYYCHSEIDYYCNSEIILHRINFRNPRLNKNVDISNVKTPSTAHLCDR